MAVATQEKAKVAKELRPLVSIEAVEALAAAYGMENFLPRVPSTTHDILENGEPVPVGPLLVPPQWVSELNDQLLGIIQDVFRATSFKMSESYISGSGVIDDRARTLVPIPGVLAVKRV